MSSDAGPASINAHEMFYVWEIPGAETVIHLSLDVVERLNAVIAGNPSTNAERQAEIGGILLGTIDPGERPAVIIESFQVVACEHWRGASWTLSPKERVKLNERLGRRQWPSGLAAVGCFRTHTRPGLYLDQDDFSVFSQYFSDPRQVFLLVRPAPGGVPAAGFFVWEEGDVRRQATRLAFPFDGAQLSCGAHPVVRRQTAGARPAPPPRRAALPVPAPLRAGWRLPAAAAAVLLLGAALYQWLAPRLAPAPRPAPQAFALRVERSGATLRLLWDRESPAVRKARAAIVNISEGERRLRIDLTAHQVAAGSVTYFPTSGDVAFDMELRGPGLSLTESVRAVVPALELPPPAPELQARMPDNEEDPPLRVERRDYAYRTAPAFRPFTVPRPAPQAPPVLAPPPELAVARRPPAPSFMAPRLRDVSVTYEPAPPSGFSRVIGRIPLVRGLQGSRRKDYVPPAPLDEIKPVVPAGMSLGNTAEPVALKVHIDEAGRVRRAELLSDNSFAANLAARAAEKWRFAPARVNGKPVSSEMLLQFKFEP